MGAPAPGPLNGPGAPAPASGSHAITYAMELEDRSRLDRLEADQRVVEAVLRGDRDAFRVVVDREASTVIAACARVLGDRSEAEDAAQEAFVLAYRSLATWRGDGPLGGWITRIAMRVALRRAASRRPVAWLDPRPGGAADAADGGHPGAAFTDVRAGDPAVLALHAERDAALRRAVVSLDEPYREVVALRFFGDRSLAEIAELTQRPLGTVKTHLHRGLARLRVALGEDAR